LARLNVIEDKPKGSISSEGLFCTYR